MFTVAPLPMKEELDFFLSGTSSMPSTVRGNELRTCHNFNKVFSCARTPCPYAHKCNKPGCGREHPGIRCLFLSEPDKQPPPQAGNSNSEHHIAPATTASDFGGVLTQVNVFNLHRALHNHPNREFVNKMCLKLMEGARIDFFGSE